MSKQNLQKDGIDRIGRKLLEASAVQPDELEKIVAAPKLFDSVKARIKAEQENKPARRARFFPVWNFQTAAGAFAVLIAFLAVAAVIVSKNTDTRQLVKQVQPPKAETPKVENIEIPKPAPEIVKTEVQAEKNPVNTAQKADFKVKTEAVKPARETKTTSQKHAQADKKVTKTVFYPLAVAGNWEGSGEDLQVVRAELSRAELFALGVNLPVENESARVKTDLLVGSDGVARAIRFVE